MEINRQQISALKGNSHNNRVARNSGKSCEEFVFIRIYDDEKFGKNLFGFVQNQNSWK